ncbi:hypothetical protein GCM10009118_24370 [Wandonia haliotis]|uniref:RHS repeat-associated core domain-containing protein n=1 Tax=Wandonia haliotis TaxID=574963 RepID=A0ABP3Y4Y1_9FLAO
MKKIERYAFSEKPDLVFTYDPMGQRISKTVYPKSAPGVIDASGIEKKYYIRDAQGNELVRYGIEQGTYSGQDIKILLLEERTIYGSSRLGMERIEEEVARSYVLAPDEIAVSMRSGLYVPGEELMRQVGDKRYELSNHLGNVLATVSDRKLAIAEAGAVYANDFTSDIDGVNAYLGGSVSHSGGRLRVTTTSQGSGAVLQYVATVPGQTYRLQLTADLAGQGSVAITAYDVPTATVTAQKVMSSNGVHYLDFLASSSTTQLRMQSQVSGTRTFYIDDLTLEKRPSVFARDLTASYADIQTYGTGVTTSISGNRLRVDNLGQWNGILCVFPTVAGRTYTVHYTLGLNGGPKLTPFVRNNITSANIQVQHITSDGRYTLTFVAPSSETMFAVENPNTGTRSMYLSYLFVQDVNAAAVVEDFYYVADVKSYSDYMPFGMTLPGRSFSSDSYRYGFNGMEKDDEIYGEGNAIDFGARMYDSRVGRWLSRDAASKVYPNLSPYSFVANSPLIFVDPSGNIIEPAPGLSDKNKADVEARIKKLSEERPNQYKYLNELRYHPTNKTFVSSGDPDYSTSFDIIIHVTITDIDGIPRAEELGNANSSAISMVNKSSTHRDGQAKRTELWQSYKLTTPNNIVFIRKNDGTTDKIDVNSPEGALLLDQQMSNGSIVQSSLTSRYIKVEPSTNGTPHVIISLDDYTPGGLQQKLETLSHELGHIEGWIEYPHQTYFYGDETGKNTGVGHHEKYEGGKIADDREKNDRKP